MKFYGDIRECPFRCVSYLIIEGTLIFKKLFFSDNPMDRQENCRGTQAPDFALFLLLLVFLAGCGQKSMFIPINSFPDVVAVKVQPGDTLPSLAENYLHDSSLDWLIAEFNEVTEAGAGEELLVPLGFYKKGNLTMTGYGMVPVLNYHNLDLTQSSKMMIPREKFEEQMAYLRDNGYRVISLDSFFDFLDFNRQLPSKSVVITFDDGWRQVYDIAWPVLKKYGYKATLFVYTDLIVGSSKTLNWDMVREMAAGGLDIQCHTKTHRNLNKKKTDESPEEYLASVNYEVAESARIIKREVGVDVKYLAYPYGETNDQVIRVLQNNGFRGAFTTKRGSNPFFADYYRIKRAMIFGGFSLEKFKKNLKTHN